MQVGSGMGDLRLDSGGMGITLAELEPGKVGIVVGVQEHSQPFLEYLDRLKLGLGSSVSILEKFDFDQSLRIVIDNKKEHTLTAMVAQNIFVQQK